MRLFSNGINNKEDIMDEITAEEVKSLWNMGDVESTNYINIEVKSSYHELQRVDLYVNDEMIESITPSDPETRIFNFNDVDIYKNAFTIVYVDTDGISHTTDPYSSTDTSITTVMIEIYEDWTYIIETVGNAVEEGEEPGTDEEYAEYGKLLLNIPSFNQISQDPSNYDNNTILTIDESVLNHINELYNVKCTFINGTYQEGIEEYPCIDLDITFNTVEEQPADESGIFSTKELDGHIQCRYGIVMYPGDTAPDAPDSEDGSMIQGVNIISFTGNLDKMTIEHFDGIELPYSLDKTISIGLMVY